MRTHYPEQIAFIGDIIGQQIMGSHFKACKYENFGPTILVEFCLAGFVLVRFSIEER